MRNISLALLARTPGLAGGEQGQDLVEYGLLCMLVSLMAIAAVPPFAIAVLSMYARITSSLG